MNDFVKPAALLVAMAAVFFVVTYSDTKPNRQTQIDNGLAKVGLERVIDGDTLLLSNGERLRIIGMEAPEPQECYGPEASEFLTNFLKDKPLVFEKDITNKDGFGRLLRHVIIATEDGGDDVVVSGELVARGYARALPSDPNNRFDSYLADLEANAVAREAGMWGVCEEAMDVAEGLRQNSTIPDNPSCNIKGNVSEKGFGKIYLLPGCPNYRKTKIDPVRGDAWFCGTKEAEAAGFRPSDSCDNLVQF